jgi:N-acetylneuraminic acid mutarotase
VGVTLPENLTWLTAVGGKVYFITVAGDVHEYVPGTGTTVTKVATAPVSIANAPQIQGQTSQSVFAGDTYNDDRVFYQFSPVDRRWIQKASFLGATRAMPVSFSIGTKFYSGLGALTDRDNLVSDIYEYTPE